MWSLQNWNVVWTSTFFVGTNQSILQNPCTSGHFWSAKHVYMFVSNVSSNIGKESLSHLTFWWRFFFSLKLLSKICLKKSSLCFSNTSVVCFLLIMRQIVKSLQIWCPLSLFCHFNLTWIIIFSYVNLLCKVTFQLLSFQIVYCIFSLTVFIENKNIKIWRKFVIVFLFFLWIIFLKMMSKIHQWKMYTIVLGSFGFSARRKREWPGHDSKVLAKQRELLLDRLQDFEDTNRALRKMLKEQHKLEVSLSWCH